MTTLQLDGKRVFLTGAASGIGAAAYTMFKERGAAVVGVDVTEADGLMHCDVADAKSVQDAIDRTVADLGGLDVVVNVAATGQMTSLEDTTLERWNRIMAVNATGPMLITKSALPHLAQSRGNIVTVGSISGLQGQPYLSAYASSKAALLHFMKCMAVELAPRHIRVNCVCPGGVGPLPDPDEALAMMPPGVDPMTFLRLSPVLPGITEQDDIADALAYLASDAARSVTGATLLVDRGTLW